MNNEGEQARRKKQQLYLFVLWIFAFPFQPLWAKFTDLNSGLYRSFMCNFDDPIGGERPRVDVHFVATNLGRAISPMKLAQNIKHKRRHSSIIYFGSKTGERFVFFIKKVARRYWPRRGVLATPDKRIPTIEPTRINQIPTVVGSVLYLCPNIQQLV